jgi:hypothetical protein
MTTLADIRAAFPEGQPVGDGWRTRCILPSHDDKNPSLTIRVEHGKVLCVCTCNRQKELFAAVMKRLQARAPQATAPSGAPAGEDWGYSLDKLRKAEDQLGQAEEFLTSRGISMKVARLYHCGYDAGYLVIPTFRYGELVSVKLRCVRPCAPENKWRKFRKYQKTYHLFGIEVIQEAELSLADDLYILESELDAMTAVSHGFHAVSVDTAGHSLNDDDIEQLQNFFGALVFCPDADVPGLQCAVRISTQLGIDHTQSIQFPKKDLGDLYAEDPATFAERLAALRSGCVSLWRQKLHSVDELAQGEPLQLIKHILPEGVTFLGSLSGVAKTWLGLSISKAVTTGERFLGVWEVPQKRNVIYLCPEMGARSFRARCEKLRLPQSDRFYCQTINDGAIALNDPLLFQAVRDLNGPVIILDTAIRFSGAESENDSIENANGLAMLAFALLRAGALAVVCLHHSKKAQGESIFMTLENVLRGTGDFGAMADCVWGLQHARKRKGNNQWDDDYLQESKNLTRVYVECVKPRDLPAADPFIVQGRPYIDDTGNLVVIASDAQVGETMDTETVSETAADQAEKLVRENPKISKNQLAKATGISRNRVEGVLAEKSITWKQASPTSGHWIIEDGLSGFDEGGQDDF